MEYRWSNGDANRKIRVTTNGNWIDFQEWSVLVTNPVTGCQNTDTLTVFFDFNACNIGLSELNDVSDLLRISPNPATNKITVSAPEIKNEAEIQILTMSGKRLFMSELSRSSNGIDEQIDVQKLKAGVYMILVVTENGFASKQLIITE